MNDNLEVARLSVARHSVARLLLCIVALMSVPEVAVAQTPAAGAPSSTGAAKLDTEDLAFQIGKELRCPVCQGMPIAESPSSMAQDMMKRVREMVAEGKTRDEIIDFFIERYGEWVLLRPRAQGFNWLIWVLPPAGLLFGLAFIWRWIRRGRAARPAVASAGTTPPGSANAAGNVAGGATSADTDDPYLRAVREQLEQP